MECAEADGSTRAERVREDREVGTGA
jgi:hypothetical protein